jgi:hypothetical protein
MTLNDLGAALLDLYKDGLTKHKKSASGGLADTTYEVEINDGKFIVYFNLPAYWKYVEYGRKAGGKFPPREAIENWIRVKPLVPSAVSGKVPTTDQLVYLVSRKIAEKGIEPTPILAEAIEGGQKMIDDFVDTLVTDTLKFITDII